MHFEGLTAVNAGESVSFKEAEVTLVCKKLLKQQLDPKNMPQEIADQFYKNDAPHDMFIGEVVAKI